MTLCMTASRIFQSLFVHIWVTSSLRCLKMAQKAWVAGTHQSKPCASDVARFRVLIFHRHDQCSHADFANRLMNLDINLNPIWWWCDVQMNLRWKALFNCFNFTGWWTHINECRRLNKLSSGRSHSPVRSEGSICESSVKSAEMSSVWTLKANQVDGSALFIDLGLKALFSQDFKSDLLNNIERREP